MEMSEKLLHLMLVTGIQDQLDDDAKAGFESEDRTFLEQLFNFHLYDYLSRDLSLNTMNSLSYGFANLLMRIYDASEKVDGIARTDLAFMAVQDDENPDQVDIHMPRAFHETASRIEKIAMHLLKLESDNTSLKDQAPGSVAVLSLCIECAGIIVSRRSNVSSTCSNACRTAGSRRDIAREPNRKKRKKTLNGQTPKGQEILRQISLQLASMLRDRALGSLMRMPDLPKELLETTMGNESRKISVVLKNLREWTNYTVGRERGINSLVLMKGGDSQIFRKVGVEPTPEALKVIKKLEDLLEKSPELYLGDIGRDYREKLTTLCRGHRMTKVQPVAEREQVRRRRFTDATEALHYARESDDVFRFKMKTASGRTISKDLSREEMMDIAENVVAERRERVLEAKSAESDDKQEFVILDADLAIELACLEEGSPEYDELLAEGFNDGRVAFQIVSEPPGLSGNEKLMELLRDQAALKAEIAAHEDQDNDERAEQMKLDELESK
jgi:hypothetical protein